jgi:glucosamine-6-phosphate deaminase
MTRVIVAVDSVELGRKAAELVHSILSGVANPVVIFPTGSSPLGMYRELSTTVQGTSGVDWKNATVFALDEYVGLTKDNPDTFRSQLWEVVAKPLGLKPSQLVTPNTEAVDPFEEALHYESQLAAHAKVSLAVVGVGRNGHLAFNEPGTPLDSVTHVAQLTDETRADNSKYFRSGEVPETAITMGLSTIMRADKIVVLALGDKKTRAVESLIKGKWDSKWPISALASHQNVTVIMDKECEKGLLLD